MTYLPRASIIRLPPGTIKLVPICLRNPTSIIIQPILFKLPDALDDAIFNVDVHVLDAVGVDHLAVSDQQPILGAL